jgi:tRNA U34 5-methylaminomethyl-2-thiouridine-forming methyltransferase MnmC
MKDKRHYLSACSINDEFIYAFGGFFGSTEQEINDTIEVFEVEKNNWLVHNVRMRVRLFIFIIFLFRILFGLAAL